MSLAAFSLSLWFGTFGLAGGTVLGYWLRLREERKDR